jgi:formate-dependent nitrite reductase membrane component NrfD
LTATEIAIHGVSHLGAQEGVALLLTGPFAGLFLLLENLVGKAIPMAVMLWPRMRRTIPLVLLAAILVMIGIYTMRYNVVVGGEYIPLL